MHPEAITDRIRLAYAAQKELCAEINRSEDGEFALGLFDVLQEMYNAGYEKARSSAIKEAREECARAMCVACAQGAEVERINDSYWLHPKTAIGHYRCTAAGIREVIRGER